ncbi:MAG: hypothetical protein PVJ27_04330, partial [Candidatus Brocadiaceae bacterium]|jgi:hypothetical protein
MAGGAAYADYEAAYSRVVGRQLIGSRTLAEAEPAAIREPSTEPEKSDLEKAREVVDILHRLNGMLFLQCVCGLRTKVPPDYEQDEIRCPRCGRTVPLPAAAVAAAGAAAAGAPGALADAVEEGESAPEPPGRLTVRHTPGEWNSFRCRCGKTVQLSPSFAAPGVECPACGRTIDVERG